MIDSEIISEPKVPSKFRELGNKYDSIEKRIRIVKTSAEKLGFNTPEEYKNDEHYWLTVMNRNHIVKRMLRPAISDRKKLEFHSLELATNEAQEFMKREKQRSTDGLTNAWSRGSLDKFLEILRSRQRDGQTIAILLLDIDDFKSYNDTYGHLEGDKILINLVKFTSANVRGTDMVARYGGEEFAVVLTNLQTEKSNEIIARRAETIRREISYKAGVTVSIGVTTINELDKDIESIYNRVDENLYKAKRAGKNTIVSDTGLMSNSKEKA
jgi:diguanylate cyclase (GGDEF)-like protein